MIDAGFYNMDCMEGMAQFPDKFFELAIVDPPYGGGNKEADSISNVTRTGGTWNKKYYAEGENKTKTTQWDVAPGQEYFNELFRVAENVIIWGGNYFDLPPSRNFVVWRKLTISESFTMAMAEYAWTNIEGNAKVFEAAPQGTKNEQRFHPTQKPVALYKWHLSNYAKPGDKILDTHVGSASSLIACHQMGFEYWGFELDADYYKAASERLAKAKAQVSMMEITQTIEQTRL